MSTKIIELTDENICKICENQLGQYHCPKCNVLYCSVTCYQSEKHIKCSETFYENCVKEELKYSNAGSESQKKMIEILKRFHEEQSDDGRLEDLDSDDDEEYPDLSERLENIDLNNVEELWEVLTADERQSFEALVASGDVSKIIPVWSPWWEYKIAEKLVQEIGISQMSNYEQNCPKILENIQSFDKITKNKPANCVKYNLLNVIAAYCCTVRYFNGDHFDFAKEAIYLITNLSKNLQFNDNFETSSLALESVHQQILLNDWISSNSELRDVMYKDVKNIMKGPEKENKMFYVKCALSDLYRLMLHSKKNISKIENDFTKRFQENELPSDKIVSKYKLKIYIRKVEYYLSYATSFDCDFI